MRRRVRVKPGKGQSMVGLVAGALFVLIGLFVVIPAAGGFGIIWTLFAVAITAVNGYNAFSEKGVATHEIVVDEEEDYFSAMSAPAPGTDDATARLNKLKELYESGLITREEYDDKRREILQEL